MLLKLIESSIQIQERLYRILHVLNNVLGVNSRMKALSFLIIKKIKEKELSLELIVFTYVNKVNKNEMLNRI